jgi:hypothetical protein
MYSIILGNNDFLFSFFLILIAVLINYLIVLSVRWDGVTRESVSLTILKPSGTDDYFVFNFLSFL